MEKKVVVIGSLNYDVCLKQERLPEEGETLFADHVEYCSGGKGANQAVQAAKLGVPTYLAGCIGADRQGEFLKENIEKYGVRTDYLKQTEGNSGMSVAQSLYDGGVRASVVKGSNNMVSRADVDALDQFLNPGDIAVFQLEIPVSVVEYAIRFCHERKCYVILNGAPAAAIDPSILKLVDLFIVNEVEAEFYSNRKITSEAEAMAAITDMTAELGNTCIYTLGKAGAVISTGARIELVPSKKVPAVESTGAGDSFVGGLCYGLIQDMDIFAAARFATCCSAITVCKTGGQPAMPVLEEVLEQYPIEKESRKAV